MGDRYFLHVLCPECPMEEYDVWFAPTCDVTTWRCPACGTVVDLCEYTGISVEDASNADEIAAIIERMKEADEAKQDPA